MNLDLNNISFSSLIMHGIPKRNEDKTACTPVNGTNLIALPVTAKAAFSSRISQSLGSGKNGIEVSIDNDQLGSFFQVAAHSLAFPVDFISKSHDVSCMLARAQASKDLAASKLLIAQGTVGFPSKKFYIVIKAEMQDGFTEDNGGLNHIDDLFLTPSQKMFKIAFLLEVVAAAPISGLFNKNNYKSYLFDHLLTENEPSKAAQYFYSEFMGAVMLYSAKQHTKDFYDLTAEFINFSNVDQETKVGFFEALRTELRSSSAVINCQDFARKNFPAELVVSYIAHLEQNKFPAAAIAKDINFITSQLKKKRTMKFENNIVISGPENMHSLVKVEDANAEFTLVKIISALTTQD